jgi:hypothetical protein
VGEFEASLRNVRLALAAPLEFGVKVTVKEADCPAAMVFGRLIPESTNSLLLLLPAETRTEAPVAVRLPFRERLASTITLPNASVAGVTVSRPGAAPVPDKAMLSVAFDASEMMARLPLTAPAVVGAKVAVKVTLWPAVRVVGNVSPVIEKPVPVTFACEMFTADPPVLVNRSDRF